MVDIRTVRSKLSFISSGIVLSLLIHSSVALAIFVAYSRSSGRQAGSTFLAANSKIATPNKAIPEDLSDTPLLTLPEELDNSNLFTKLTKEHYQEKPAPKQRHPKSDNSFVNSTTKEFIHLGGERGQFEISGFEPMLAPPPPFPISARKVGFSGTTEVEIKISSSGHVIDGKISLSSGREDCDRSALETITNEWLFPPSDREVTIKKVRINFRLNKPKT